VRRHAEADPSGTGQAGLPPALPTRTPARVRRRALPTSCSIRRYSTSSIREASCGPAGTRFLYALAAGLTQPIFDNGALAGRLDQAKTRQDELTANYRAAVIAAFVDVQKALQAVSNLARQQTAQELVVAEFRRAFALSSTQYRAGAEDMLTVLDTQRVLYAAQDQLGQTRLARLQAARRFL
jgi:outer membrane protein TolC